jgi:hypothetical protein
MAYSADEMVQAEPSPAPAPAEKRVALATTASELPGAADASEPAEATQIERLRVYSADMTMSVASVDDSRNELLTLTERLGGYVESSQAQYVVLRVPAARFDVAIEEIAALGTVVYRSVRAADVTDQYTDATNRLRIAVAARDRLQELLKRTDDPEEQVKVLRDIRRLTEEIEQLRGELASLDELIAYSRIAVTLEPRYQTDQFLRGEIPFPWIRRLDPLDTTTSPPRSKIPINIDDDFALFDTGKRIHAESADGVRLRIGAVPNAPKGDAEFWERALAYHLRLLYRSVDPVEAGSFVGVELEAKSASPFYYLVLVAPRSAELLVAEVFFPNRGTYDKRRVQVLAMLEAASP